MPAWLPPFLAGTLTIAALWFALVVQRLLAYRKSWAFRALRELHQWDGRLPPTLER